MSARDDWHRLPYPHRRRLLDALATNEVRAMIAAAIKAAGIQDGEYVHNHAKLEIEYMHDLATALAVLEET